MKGLRFPPELYIYLAMVFVFCGQSTFGICCLVLYLTNRARRAKPKARRRK